MSPRSNAGRHEHGQNFLVDQAVISSILAEVAAATGPLLEIGGGGGAVTTRLAATGRPLTVVEIDDRWVRRLRRSLPAHVDVVHDDYLRVRHPRGPHVVVASLPFHLTTAMLRRLLGEREWTHAVLLVQWEVARRRAGVGGATLLTAQWWPWYDFTLLRRVPLRAFSPSPSVDGGLLRIDRRPVPAVRERREFQRFAQRVFTGSGSGVPEVLRCSGFFAPRVLAAWLDRRGIGAGHLPKDLRRQDREELWALRATAPRRPRAAHRRVPG